MGLLIGVPFAYSKTDQTAYSKLNQEDQKLYYLTYESCQVFMADNTPRSAILTVLNPQAIDVMLTTMGDVNYMMGKYFEGDSNAFDRLVRNDGLGSYIQTLLHSDGFTLALRDCFPNEARRNAYVFNLLVLDGTAKFVLTYGATIGYMKFLKWSYAYIHLPWVKVLFYGHIATLLTADSVGNNKSFADLMKEQYNNLSSQIEALIQSQKKSP
jgi:hypothetical protein